MSSDYTINGVSSNIPILNHNQVLNNAQIPEGYRAINITELKETLPKKLYLYYLLMLIIYHAFVNIQFLYNLLNSNNFLKIFKNTNYIPESIFPGLIDFNIVNSTTRCSEGYSEANLNTWEGTAEGYYMSKLKYNGECSFTSCYKNYIGNGYRVSNCYTSNDVYKRECCKYELDTPFPYQCSFSSKDSTCNCPETYFKNDQKSLYINVTQMVGNYTELPRLEKTPIKIFDGMKICQRFISNKNFTLFAEKCDGVKCWEHFCLKNIEKCPALNITEYKVRIEQPIIKFALTYNSHLRSKIKQFTFFDEKQKINENGNLFSNVPFIDESGGNYSMSTEYVDDIYFINKFPSKSIYSENSILEKIFMHDKLMKLDEGGFNKYKLEPFLTDKLFLSASTYFKIKSKNFLPGKCLRSDIFDIINDSVYTSREIILYEFSLFWCLLLLVLLAIPLTFPVFCVFNKIKGPDKIEDINYFRLILISNIIYLLFNLAMLFIYTWFDLNNLIKNLDDVNSCFYDGKFVSYLQNLRYGINSYNELFQDTLKYTVIENTAFLVLFILLINPLRKYDKLF